jgi:hypothetical protein
VADLISVPFQNNFNFNTGPEKRSVWVLNVQPVIPIKLTEDWNLITRTIVPIMNQPPLAPGVDQATGLGDINPSFLPLALRLEGVHLGYRPAVHVPERDQPAARHLLLVTVQRVNDVFNAPTAGGPTPDRTPDYEAFADFAARLQRLRLAGLVGLNWEPKEHESAPPGRNPHFWLHSPDPHSPLAADVAAVRHYLGLEPGKDDFRLTAFPFQRQPTEVGLRCRSLLGVLYFLSQAVEVPMPDVQAGLVTVTEDRQGRPFDWARVTGKVMHIHSQQDRPQRAYIAVQHRGWWFYIADDDPSSKATFNLVNILFSLQAATGKGKSPILTLPVG